ncbi:hypothetical protein NL676_019381, partial [Syzygium grande]
LAHPAHRPSVGGGGMAGDPRRPGRAGEAHAKGGRRRPSPRSERGSPDLTPPGSPPPLPPSEGLLAPTAPSGVGWRP